VPVQDGGTQAGDTEPGDTEPGDTEPGDTEDADGVRPYQKDSEWWYRYHNPMTREVTPRGPFTSPEDALADNSENLAAWVPADHADEVAGDL
jgi:hypothetical protein